MEVNILMELYHKTGGSSQWICADWEDKREQPLQWHGITCSASTGKVRGIDLSKNNLVGSIPYLGGLKGLVHVNLSGNRLSGEFPSSTIASLHSLEHLDLSSNQYIGSLPDCFAGLASLRAIDLASNNFVGQIPPSLFKCTELRVLNLSNNNFMGDVPENISTLKYLQSLNFSHNSFTGMIPQTIHVLTHLEFINFSHNHLSGDIPTAFTNMIKLKEILLDHNKLTGALPERVEVLGELKALRLDHNLLSGTLPLRLGYIRNCKYINLSNNRLKGPVPKSVNDLDLMRMEMFDVSNNSLSGELPSKFVTSLLQARNSGVYTTNISGNSRGFSLSDDIDISAMDAKFVDMSSMSLRFAITEKLIHILQKRYVNLTHNFLEGELSLTAIRYICGSRLRGYKIDLGDNNGFTLPKEIGKLGNEIQVLDLSNCSLRGSIPHSINMFPQGTVINLSQNRLSGILPSGIVRLASVLYSSNILDSLAGLCNSFNPYGCDKKVSLDNNDGFILPDLKDLGDAVASIDLSKCSLVGQVTESVTCLTQATRINLSGNSFTGQLTLPIVAFICKLRSKGYAFNLRNNMGELKLPLNLDKLASVPPTSSSSCRHIDLSHCSLCGQISTSIGAFKSLDFLSLEGNNFSGEIPIGLIDIILMMRRLNKPVNLKNAGKLTLPNKFHELSFVKSTELRFKKVDLSFCSLIDCIPPSIHVFKNPHSMNKTRRGNQSFVELDFTGNDISARLPVSIVRLTNLQSITMNFDGTTGGGCTSLDYASMQRYLLRDIAIGVYNEEIHEIEEEVLADPEKILWKAMLSSTFTALEVKIKKIIGKYPNRVANAYDMMGHSCMNVATPSNRIAARAGMFFAHRYDVLPIPPIHRSNDSVVIKAIDRGYELKLRSYFWANYKERKKLTDVDAAAALASIDLIDESVVSSSVIRKDKMKKNDEVTATEENFVTLCEQYIKTVFSAELIPTVALKFVTSTDIFTREMMIRTTGNFDERYVCEINKEDDARILTEAMDLFPLFCSDELKNFNHVLVLGKFGNNLNETIKKNKPCRESLKNIFRGVAEALFHVHEKGVVHGDVRGCNIICISSPSSQSSTEPTSPSSEEEVSFIDFSKSARFFPVSGVSNTPFVGEYLGVRFQPEMSLPPEAFFKLNSGVFDNKEEKSYLSYFANSSTFDAKDLPIFRSRRGTFVPKLFEIESVNMDGSVIPRAKEQLPYKLLLASPQVDIWAFGMLLLEILGDGLNLINQAATQMRDTMTNQAAKQGGNCNLALWKDEEIQLHIIKKISDPILADLLGKILRVDPSKRITSMSRIMAHPFFGLTISTTVQFTDDTIYTQMAVKNQKVNEESFFMDKIYESKQRHVVSVEKILRQTVYFTDSESLTPTNLVILNRNVSQASPSSTQVGLRWAKKLAVIVFYLNALSKLPYFFDCENQVCVEQSSEEIDIARTEGTLSDILSDITKAIRNLFTDESEFWLYFYDEVTMNLLDEAPFMIQPVEVIPRILSIFHLSLRTVAVTSGAKGIAEVLRVPCQTDIDGSIVVDASVLDIASCLGVEYPPENIICKEYDLLVKSGMPNTIHIEDPWQARLFPLVELDHLYAKSLVNLNGLKRVYLSDTASFFWTRLSACDLMKRDTDKKKKIEANVRASPGEMIASRENISGCGKKSSTVLWQSEADIMPASMYSRPIRPDILAQPSPQHPTNVPSVPSILQPKDAKEKGPKTYTSFIGRNSDGSSLRINSRLTYEEADKNKTGNATPQKKTSPIPSPFDYFSNSRTKTKAEAYLEEDQESHKHLEAHVNGAIDGGNIDLEISPRTPRSPMTPRTSRSSDKNSHGVLKRGTSYLKSLIKGSPREDAVTATTINPPKKRVLIPLRDEAKKEATQDSEDTEEVYRVEIDGISYFVTNEENGIIYDDNSNATNLGDVRAVGKIVGKYEDGNIKWIGVQEEVKKKKKKSKWYKFWK